MAGYRFEVKVSALSDRSGTPVEAQPLQFETENHDNILAIVERLQQRTDLGFGPDETAAFAVGLKLFSEVMLKHRQHPLFEPLREAFPAFMQNLKRGA